MEFTDAARIVAEVPAPHIPANRGRVLYEHIRKNRPENLLELGTARGGSAIFMAAALEANGAGHLTSVDSTRWRWRNPTPQEVLDNSGLSHRVTLDRRFSTYTWFLKTELEACIDDAGVHPKYDFIFLDGAKNWSTDGLAVVISEKLLRPGGWLLLDDLGWTYAKYVDNANWHYEIEIAKLSDEEREEPHLRAIFDLLICPNAAFDQFLIEDDWWGWARKSADPARAAGNGVVSVRTEIRTVRAHPILRRVRGVHRRLLRLREAPARLPSH